MRRTAASLACCILTLSLLLVSGCKEDPAALEGYSKVTPASIPGTKVEVLDPIQLTEKARIPENDPAYKSVEVFKDRLVFHYSSAPTIALEAGHVVAGGDKVGYLRKIRSVTTQTATKVAVETESAYLGEFIYKGHLRVTQEPAAKDWDNAGGEINSKCYPLGPENSYSVFKSFGSDPAIDCKVSAGAALKVEPALTITPKIIFEVDFDPGYLLIDGELVYAKFALEGSVVAGVTLKGKGVLSAKCEADIIKALRLRANNDQLFKMWLPTIRFAVGPVPVVITHYFEPIAKSTLEAKLEVLEVIGTGQVRLGVKAGTEYKDKKWIPIWQPSRSGSVSLKLGDDLFKVSLSDELAFGLGYTALLYSTAGPKLGLTLGATLSASASPDTCKWDAKLELGVNFEYGAELQVPVLDKKIWDASGKVELFKRKIFGTDGDIPGCQADAGVEAGAEAGIDAGPDLGFDIGGDMTPLDAVMDAPTDVPLSDAVPDGPPDAATDAAPADAAPDAPAGLLSSGRLLFPNRGLDAIVVFDPVSQKAVGTVKVPSPFSMSSANYLFTALYRAADKSIYLNVLIGTKAGVIAFTEGGTVLGSHSSGESYIQQMILDPSDTSQTTVLAGAPFSNDVKAINPIAKSMSTRLTITKGNIIGLLATGGKLLVGDHNSGTLRWHAVSGAALSTFANLGTLTGKKEINGMTRDSAGNIYIAQNSSSRIVRLTAAGALSGYISVSVFNKPAYVFFNPNDGLLYVGNQADDGLVIVTTSGALIKRVGLGGSNVGQGTLIP